MCEGKVVITGIDARLKRFDPIVCKDEWTARCYNIYRGTAWKIVNGKRKKLWEWLN